MYSSNGHANEDFVWQSPRLRRLRRALSLRTYRLSLQPRRRVRLEVLPVVGSLEELGLNLASRYSRGRNTQRPIFICPIRIDLR